MGNLKLPALFLFDWSLLRLQYRVSKSTVNWDAKTGPTRHSFWSVLSVPCVNWEFCDRFNLADEKEIKFSKCSQLTP